ncbi:MAG: radical SAM protein [Ruminococcaceae bacterium]|nr:radical SAM protein [Oscillospiraceae bacterium]
MAKQKIIPIFVPHLGCPCACVFCNQRRISGVTAETTADMVKSEIEAALERIGSEAAQVAFYGGSFTAIDTEKQESLLAAAHEYVKAGKVTSIRISTRPDAIDEDVISRLKRYCVDTVELGCQSMNDEVLRLSKRGHDGAVCEKAAMMLKNAGFKVILQIMTGLPGDDGSQSLETAARVVDIKPDGVRIYPTVVVRDTELFDLWEAGVYKEHTVNDAVELCAVLCGLFDKAGIPIIRLGLNPTEELSGGAAAAGAYHPALGELVRSRMWLKRLRQLLDGKELPQDIVITVPKGAVSLCVGQKKANIECLKSEYGLRSIKIRESDRSNGDISLHF